MMTRFTWSCAGLTLAAAVAAAAQEQTAAIAVSAPEQVQRHTGTFLRPDVGVGYLAMNTSDGAMLTGFAETYGAAAGVSITQRSVVALHVWEAVVRNPSMSMGGSWGGANSSATLLAIGPEYTAYSKDNYFLSVSPSLTRITVETNGITGATNWGLGLRAALGKEWWASEHWGLGVVGQLSVSLNEDSGPNAPTWTAWATTIAFSATYN
ncbi:MAG TPA: hypothetical protein VFA79_02025 [Myxococcales bacterium]|nr:hypothetical protein [Myxococcales bacterium]